MWQDVQITNVPYSDAFADKTSLICLKNSIRIYIMTIKMTDVLLSSRYRREIKIQRNGGLKRKRDSEKEP